MDEVTLFTRDNKDCFEANEKAGAVLIDLTAAHDTVWHWGMRRLVQFLLI